MIQKEFLVFKIWFLKRAILFAFSFPFFTYAQIGPVNFIDTSFQTAGITQFESTDIDGDGFEEIITSSTGNSGRLGYYTNLKNNTYSAFNQIEPYSFCKGFAIGDFNNDNWNDVVSIGGIDMEARLHFSDSGSFVPSSILDSNISIQVNDVVVADFDGNNSDDIVIIGQHSIDFYRNNGVGIFTKEVILSTSTSALSLECLDLAAEDMDGDGDIDLICGETEGLVVYMNNGNAIFTPNYFSVLSEIYFVIHPFDIDNDGDIDVIGKNNAGEIKWFSNNGIGVMTYEATISHLPKLRAFKSIDYNNDGLEDIYASFTGKILIYENDTNQSFSNEIAVYQNNSLLMGPVQIINIDNLKPLDYIWSGGNNAVAIHVNTPTLSINEAIDRKLLVYPNPNSGSFFIESVSSLDLYIYSSSGVLVKEQTVKPGKAFLELSLKEGSYVVKAMNPQYLKWFKLIVSK